ncbi:hypothetical protein QO179_23830 [Bacillus stercoris]|nr:hypothetical protein [Bacillus stercoris]
MKVLFTKELENNVYSVTVEISDVAVTDTDLFHDFGQPMINLGGEIKDQMGNISITMPSNMKRLTDQFPVTVKFSDLQYNNNAKNVANAWIFTVEQRISEAMNELRLKTDDFTGTEDFLI